MTLPHRLRTHARIRRLACSACAALALAALAWPAAGWAQVVRCTDPATGSVTYTNGRCDAGARGVEIAPSPSAEDIARERRQAAEAEQRKQARRAQEHAAAQAAAQAQAAPAPAQPPDPAQSSACRQARQALAQQLATLDPSLFDTRARLDAAQRQADLACLTPYEQARIASERAADTASTAPVIVVPPPHQRPPHHQRPPRPQPREITHCNVFRCYDSRGNTYPIP